MANILKHMLFIVLSAFPLLLFSGCGRQADEISPSQKQTPPTETEATEQEEPRDIVLLYHEIYEDAVQGGSPGLSDAGNLATVQKITRTLGAHGFTAIDSENQVDMANARQMNDFIAALESGKTAGLTVLVVSAHDRFSEYNLQAKEGVLEAVRTYYQYTDSVFEEKSRLTYSADSWRYTDEGYFIFKGKSFSEESLVLTMSEEEEAAAWRVEPLNAQYREWNRQYLLPIGYGRNNMFLVDWNEKDYGSLDFYDIFDKCYPLAKGQPLPYMAGGNAADGVTYRIPEKEFEDVVALHLAVDSATLRAKTTYLEDSGFYEYHPRGFYEAEYPNLPYPEVVSGTENEDGTLTLLVNAIYPQMETSRAFTHELIVRPNEPGSFQYISNRILRTESDCDMGWHTDRLTEEEWKNAYSIK